MLRFVFSTHSIVSTLLASFRLSYLPPLMVYIAYGVSGLTGIVGTFFVKDYLGLSAEFLAALGFWAQIPWALKMPLGHLVDLLWRWKSWLVCFGAVLLASSLGIMLGLIAHTAFMRQFMPIETWYILSVLLLPIGYVVQDVVADAMTVEAVPQHDDNGEPYSDTTLKTMHTTMQTLGRFALVGGNVLVAVVNLYMFSGVENMPSTEKATVYANLYRLAMLIPLISVLGVVLAGWLKFRQARRHRTQQSVCTLDNHQAVTPNWTLLIGSLGFVVFTVSFGLAPIAYNQEIIFLGSFCIVLFLMKRLVNVLDENARRVLVGTAVVIFAFRAVPGPGVASSWWMIDQLGFDQHFMAILSLIGSALALLAMCLLQKLLTTRSVSRIFAYLTLATFVLNLPGIGMFFGLHIWTARLTGGIVDARFIALVDTALESPLGQVAMIPMLAWIANSAPRGYKATFFAVMTSFTNLALSLSQLGTKYLNQWFVVTREVHDPVSGATLATANYAELGKLLIASNMLTLLIPMLAIFLVQKQRHATL